MTNAHVSDAAKWDGDPESLIALADELMDNPGLGDELFATKWEAFAAGRDIGQFEATVVNRRLLWGVVAYGFGRAHRAGTVSAPDHVTHFRESLPFSDGEIEEAFDRLVDEHGATAGRTVLLDDLTPQWAESLEQASLIARDANGCPAFTLRGAQMLALLELYGSSRNVWISNVYESAEDAEGAEQ